MDELHLEELSLRMTQEKMDDAFCAAMQRAIDAGAENTPTVVSKKPGTRNPKSVIGRRLSNVSVLRRAQHDTGPSEGVSDDCAHPVSATVDRTIQSGMDHAEARDRQRPARERIERRNDRDMERRNDRRPTAPVV